VSVLLDLQGTQSRAHGERGVARYLAQLSAALERNFPGAVAQFLVNPDLPITRALGSLPPPSRLGSTDALPADFAVYHVGSPFEPDVTLDRLWPAQARKRRLAVTLYDLIPELFAETYLAEPHVRGWYRARLGVVRHADRVLAISRSTAKDAVERLGLRPERVAVVGTAPAPFFVATASREAALAEVRQRLPEIEPGFVLYTGGIEFRKNIDRLLEAYAGLPAGVRREHQLVIVCKVRPAERAALEERLRELGVVDRVHFTGYVEDEELRLLYGSAHLFVFPALYEGYGLPVAEAIACGAPVIASNTSSLVELVEDEHARFDPYDVNSIRATLARALADSGFREHLRESQPQSIGTWDDVAARTVEAYNELEAHPRRRRPRSRRRIAYVSPLPPQSSGIADYSYRLLEPLSRHFEVDAFSDSILGPAEAPAGIRVSATGHFDTVERVRGGYDHVLVCLGNSEHHAAALALLRRRRGVVLAHDVRLSGLYAFCADRRPEVEPRPFVQILAEMYGQRVPAGLGDGGWLDPLEADAHGIFMAREAIAYSDRYLVHSLSAQQLARYDAREEDRTKILVAPFAFPDPAQFAGLGPPGVDPTIGTFGVVAAVKQTAKVLEAFRYVARERPACRLAIVGPPAGEGDLTALRERTAELELGDRVSITGRVDEDRFRSLIAGTTVAVQLRSVSMGESPASVSDCLAAGVATVATAIGSVRELPDDALVKVQPDIHPEELGRLLLSLLDDDTRRSRLGEAGKELARERSFERSAQFLAELLDRLEHASREAA
jgi:glycosyltransferase involved in cell wall biosynthesis